MTFAVTGKKLPIALRVCWWLLLACLLSSRLYVQKRKAATNKRVFWKTKIVLGEDEMNRASNGNYVTCSQPLLSRKPHTICSFLFLPTRGFQSRFRQHFENDWLITVPVTKSARSLRRIGVDRWPALVIIIADPAVDAKVNGDLFLQHKVDLKCSRNLHTHRKKCNNKIPVE